MLYVLGGEDGERELISMESYDIYNRTWTKQPDLTMVRKVGVYSTTTVFQRSGSVLAFRGAWNTVSIFNISRAS